MKSVVNLILLIGIIGSVLGFILLFWIIPILGMQLGYGPREDQFYTPFDYTEAMFGTKVMQYGLFGFLSCLIIVGIGLRSISKKD